MTECQVTRWRELPAGWTGADGAPAQVLDRVTADLDAGRPAGTIAGHLDGLGR